MSRRIALFAALVLCATISLSPVEASHLALPNDMAALGDSITQAMNSSGRAIGDNPENSWSTGYDSRDGVSSHYERILALNAKIKSKNYNDAVSGAKMADLPGQADQAVTQSADYVTILMGANDVCTSSKTTMTSVDDFRAQFRAAADKLSTGLPTGSVVYVASIPDIYNLWYVLKDDARARNAWKTFSICQSMLSESNTEEDRQFVRQRNIDFNTVLEQESAAYGFHWDGQAVFQTQFVKEDVSTLDYFHPSLKGQAKLAEGTWSVGPYAS